MRTHSCRPGLKDTQVLDFCKQGFLVLEGVVPQDINRRTVEFLDKYPSHEPSEILHEDWFVDNVILNDQAAGAVRSLLGQNFGLPIVMSNHRVECPSPAQNWHRDGNSKHGPALNYLQVFYYPEDCSLDLGPTELLPGSHFLFSLSKKWATTVASAALTARPPPQERFSSPSIRSGTVALLPAARDFATCSSTTTGARSHRTGTGSGNPASTLPRQITSWRTLRFGSSFAIVTTLPRCSTGCSAGRTPSRWQEVRAGR